MAERLPIAMMAFRMLTQSVFDARERAQFGLPDSAALRIAKVVLPRLQCLQSVHHRAIIAIGGRSQDDKHQNDVSPSKSRIFVPCHCWELASSQFKVSFAHIANVKFVEDKSCCLTKVNLVGDGKCRSSSNANAHLGGLSTYIDNFMASCELVSRYMLYYVGNTVSQTWKEV